MGREPYKPPNALDLRKSCPHKPCLSDSQSVVQGATHSASSLNHDPVFIDVDSLACQYAHAVKAPPSHEPPSIMSHKQHSVRSVRYFVELWAGTAH